MQNIQNMDLLFVPDYDPATTGQKVICLCGAVINDYNKQRHILSIKHQRIIRGIPDLEAERAAQDLIILSNIAWYAEQVREAEQLMNAQPEELINVEPEQDNDELDHLYN
jgi:hypothetical protein